MLFVLQAATVKVLFVLVLISTRPVYAATVRVVIVIVVVVVILLPLFSDVVLVVVVLY